MKKKNWYKLDNAAKLYPAISSYSRSSMFSISAVLDETIDAEVLNNAVNVVLSRFPTFKVKLKRGFFWYYLEENENPFIIKPEPSNFLEFINEKENNDYLFNVFYLYDKITLSVFHSLCDGTGALDFLKAIIYEYLLLKGYKMRAEGMLKTIYSPPTANESMDNFLQVCGTKKEATPKEENAFKTYGTSFNSAGQGIIIGKVMIDELKIQSKKHGVSITGYLTGLMSYAIYTAFIKGKKTNNKNVKILIPVNMRKHYDSSTVRNFSLFCRTSNKFDNEISLDECILSCDKQIKEQNSKEKLAVMLSNNVKIEKNWALKLVPLFLKDLAMKLAFNVLGDNLHSANLSNLGVIELPASVKKHVKDFMFMLATSYSCKNHLAVISYDDHINLVFTRSIVENDFEKHFFRTLENCGINVEVESNYWESEV